MHYHCALYSIFDSFTILYLYSFVIIILKLLKNMEMVSSLRGWVPLGGMMASYSKGQDRTIRSAGFLCFGPSPMELAAAKNSLSYR